MTDPNDPAFNAYSTDHLRVIGLTKREYFAAMAMCGALANTHMSIDSHPSIYAVKSVAFADALIAELNKPKESKE